MHPFLTGFTIWFQPEERPDDPTGFQSLVVQVSFRQHGTAINSKPVVRPEFCHFHKLTHGFGEKHITVYDDIL
ncbi:MAG: hypothetical protein M1368_03295, partial [Thaumarchaeota archaeon]|nr:hypothetical protein [Nitrososphaerota archaeon]